MKKITLTIWACILCILCFITLLLLVAFDVIRPIQPESACRFYFDGTEISLRDGAFLLDDEPGRDIRTVPFTLSRAGKYNIRAAWSIVSGDRDEPGFLTVLLLTDSRGRVLTWLSGDWGDWELEPMELEDGEYTVEYRYFCNEGEYRAFLSSLSGESEDSFEGYEHFGEEGTWTIRYAFEIEEQSAAYRPGYRAGVLIGAGVGILFFAVPLFILILKSGKKAGKKGFDERQEMVRGKAFQYGFFTMFAYYMSLYICRALALPIPVDVETEIFLGIVFGTIPFSCYSVWKDAYFQINENKPVIIALFALIGILNTAIGVGNLYSGHASAQGRISMGILPLSVGIMFLCLLMTGILKAIHERREERS